MPTSSDASLEPRHAVAIRRIGLFLGRPVERIEANLPGALRDALCGLPWESRLRRDRDRVLLEDARLLFKCLEPDDPRRPTLKFLIEHAERRTRM